MRQVEISLPELHPGQARMVENAKRYNVLMCGRRYGKTTFGVERALDAVLAGQPVGWFAPTYAYLLDPWHDLTGRVAPLIARSSRQEKQIRLHGGGILDFWTLDNPDAGRGRKYARVVIDEAGIQQRLDDVFNSAIRPTLSDLKGDAYFLGTPKGRGAFYRFFARGKANEKGWASFSGESVDNPYMDPDEIESARLMLPQHVFDQEYRGIPADDAGNPFDIRAIEACVGPMSDGVPICFGIDLARSQDWTVVVGIDKDGAVCRFDRFQLGWDEQVQRIKRTTGDLPAMVDATGVGDAVCTMLQHAGVYVEPFKFTGQSKQELMSLLQTAIQMGTVRYPDGPIADELRSFEYQIKGGHTFYSAPSGLHDDCVMALAMALRYKDQRPTLEIKVWK